METKDFIKTLDLGTYGEDLVQDWFEKQGIHGRRTSGPSCCPHDMELGNGLRVEVKTLRKAGYHNFIIETVQNVKTGSPGWIYTCDADYIFYVDAPTKRLRIVKYIDLVDAFNSGVYQPHIMKCGSICAFIPEDKVPFEEYNMDEDQYWNKFWEMEEEVYEDYKNYVIDHYGFDIIQSIGTYNEEIDEWEYDMDDYWNMVYQMTRMLWKADMIKLMLN